MAPRPTRIHRLRTGGRVIGASLSLDSLLVLLVELLLSVDVDEELCEELVDDELCDDDSLLAVDVEDELNDEELSDDD